MSSIGIAAVGAGAWGSQVIRTLASTPGALLRWICDSNPATLARAAGTYPGVGAAAALDDALADPAVDAVVVASNAASHFKLARQALQAGRHVLCEKPLALRPGEAAELNALAERARKTLMVGHLLIYDPAIMFARSAIESGELGDVLMLHTQRTNLGTIRRRENAWWSLAPHDVAIALYLLGAAPTEVSATGAGFVQKGRGVEDAAFATLKFAGGALAHIHVSWLDPLKRRALTVVGTRKMLTFEESATEQRLKLFDRRAGVEKGERGVRSDDVLPVHRGDVFAPPLPAADPLLVQCSHFIECVRTGRRPRSDGAQGVAVVRVLEAGQRSIEAGGAPAPLT